MTGRGRQKQNLNMKVDTLQTELNLLADAAKEIENLRRENREMSLRLEMFDNIMALLNTDIARKGYGMGEDLVYKINKQIEQRRLEAEMFPSQQ